MCQVGKTQRVRMLRQAPETDTPGGEAPGWALVYTPFLTLSLARVEHTEKGEVVAVFTADLRLADDVGIDTKRCVLGAPGQSGWAGRGLSWRFCLTASDLLRLRKIEGCGCARSMSSATWGFTPRAYGADDYAKWCCSRGGG